MAGEDPLERLAAECLFDFFRGSGPGGQHRNTTESGVRVIHVPTGLRAQASERRSQARNREEALRRLAEKLAARARRRAPRIPTRKGAGVRAREAEAKKHASRRKAARRPPRDED